MFMHLSLLFIISMLSICVYDCGMHVHACMFTHVLFHVGLNKILNSLIVTACLCYADQICMMYNVFSITATSFYLKDCCIQ